ncbi:MAG: hypothetical protein JHD07_00740 [Bradyrhizobium sp.]|jgi:hypothetical protein|uniref:hypothetical protein n=1 Tax=Bradyrhizobium sp. TaxID=376 RepID=UPI001A29C29B|nr:hypothetical protein [Bradyrhizobium sp.]MBJ7401902.1 hypothetical protein [Bradyrhizobium sp.]
MARIAAAVALFAAAIGVILLMIADENSLSSFLAYSILVSACVAGLLAVNKPLARLWRGWTGPYPLHMICIWICRIGVVKDKTQMISFLTTLQEGARKGELDFYGQLMTENSRPELTRIPSAHFDDHAIDTKAVMAAKYNNEQVCTFRSREKSSALTSSGECYCNLHVNRKVLRLVMGMWDNTHD